MSFTAIDEVGAAYLVFEYNINVVFLWFKQIISEGEVHKLIIPEVFPEDSGLFMCRAFNDFGIAECTAELYIEGISDYTCSADDNDSVLVSRSPSPY